MKIYLQADKDWKLFDVERNDKELKRRSIKISSKEITIGNDVRISNHVRINSYVQIGKNVKIGNNVLIDDWAIINNYTTIGNNVKLGNNVWIRNCVKLGNNIKIEDDAQIDNNVTIDDNVRIGKNVRILSSILDKNLKITSSPIYIMGTKGVAVAECGVGLIKIGDIINSIDDWFAHYKKIANDCGYTPDEIKEYGEHLEYAARHTTISRLKQGRAKQSHNFQFKRFSSCNFPQLSQRHPR